ncbi:MAG: hypothetical protein LQ352_007851 [Teloschistes flavicans]|nr:MAG: hypothetical protein LQ352_007851 [Teloschistes flavicans]
MFKFFLLKPDKASLQRRLDDFNVDDLLNVQGQTQLLFRQAVARLRSENGTLVECALDTLTVFLGIVLAKRYTNPSAEIITVLVGLDEVDIVFADFANAIENVVRSGGSAEISQKAIEVAITLTAGAYQTSLVSYFTHRDLFPCLMKYIQEAGSPARVLEPFLLLGLLANYNKFEFRNPYRLKLEDFVNEMAIQKIIRGFGLICSQSRDRYVAVQDDIGEGWTWSNTLKYIGLGVLAPSRSSTPTRNPEETRDRFAELPDNDASILVAAYDFTNANKLFCYTFVSQTGESKSESPLGAFLSLTSYILNHAYRSPRATLYGLLNVTALRILIEDQTVCTKIFDPDLAVSVRFCRQRQPFLPSSPKPRPAAAAILDIALDAINHNLRRRLDIPLYIGCINILHRLLSYLVITRTRLTYHWPLLWQTLLSLLRFLTSYASSLIQEPDLPALIDGFLATLSLAVCRGDFFLPDTNVYDDLFYKLVENAHLLPRFKTAFVHLSRPPSTAPATANPNTITSPLALVDILIAIAKHFEAMIEEEKTQGKTLSPKDVMGVIRKGCETLVLPECEGLERWVRWREVDERGMLKKCARAAVEDARRVVNR